MNPITFLVILLPILLLPSLGLVLSLRGTRTKRAGALSWEAVPILLVLFLLVLLCGLNWPYESKVLLPRSHDPRLDTVGTYLGPILLAVGVVLALIAGALLYLLRQIGPYLFGTQGRWYFWIPTIVLGLLITVLVFAAASLVVLGPAAITMEEQMTLVPEAHPRHYP